MRKGSRSKFNFAQKNRTDLFSKIVSEEVYEEKIRQYDDEFSKEVVHHKNKYFVWGVLFLCFILLAGAIGL